MKIYHFTLIFAILALSVMSVCESSFSLSSFGDDNRKTLDTAFDRACDTAALTLRGYGEELSDELILRAQTQFINSLCTYYGINAFSQEGRTLAKRISILAVTCPDGMYVGYIDSGSGSAVRKWTEKIFYTERSPAEILEEYCYKTEIGSVPDPMALRFELPQSDDGLFQRGLKEIGFAAYYRKPVSGRGADYTFASSVSKPADAYYINLRGTGYGSTRYYHIGSCIYKSDECMEFDSREECAGYGAFCCPVCKDIVF